ncbi:MAG TPA: bifunctional phosphoribosylaminoimidazolecarboxamide formyltransferase/IMP cyclohydrolase [Candidatus Eisenbacteria bacterium]|nr:bifunctional phosphoribosylaminoimidazolecarboxamide formyltransferase/IMP cyclohydrolase [Candidatus Eisenbacteria bacterium]
MNKISRALVSVFDKTGVLEFARALDAMGVEILSTGGTADLLRKSGVPVVDVSKVTNFPEMLDGRVKTLHPNLHGGILAVRDDREHMRTIEAHGIRPIDLVAVNLYPFGETLQKTSEESRIIEMIDIGGPSMLRGAAKNFRFVAAVCDPADYAPVIAEMQKSHGALGDATRRRLAGKAFRTTAEYDAQVAGYFGTNDSGRLKLAIDEAVAKFKPGTGLPPAFKISFEKDSDLRYGENPHQKGALYREPGSARGVLGANKLNGKELSFNNILDLDAALEMVEAFTEPACSVVKHTSPCGFALGRDATSAFKAAHACDPLSAFGGIVGLNVPVDAKAARAILKSGFLECVIAAEFTREALELLRTKKNLRLLAVRLEAPRPGLDFKKVKGGLLLQEADLADPGAADLKTVTKKKPTAGEVRDLLFAFKVCRYVKSNAIVVAKKGVTVGLGMGQPSRVDSCLTAFRKAGSRARGAVLASDGFFPKPDSISLARRHGVRAIIQPGGSIQDEAVIAACDKAGIAMVFSGVRHFKH